MTNTETRVAHFEASAVSRIEFDGDNPHDFDIRGIALEWMHWTDHYSPEIDSGVLVDIIDSHRL